MSDARRYTVWPEPRSRSRSLKGSRPSVPHGTNFFIPFLLLSSYIIDFMYIMIMNVFVPLSHIKRLLTYLIKLETLIKVS